MIHKLPFSKFKINGKKIALSMGFLFAAQLIQAQNGLEDIIVERYYVSDANDTTVNSSGGVLPIGSVTYRIYVDMKQGYKFQAAYGVNTPGGAHELKLATTSLFFNNEDRGATSPTFTKNQAKNNTVMLDSWLSVGAACAGNFGVLKTDDDGVSTIINNDGVLQNSDPLAGIPLTTQDGLMAGTPEAVTSVGISNEIAMFDAQNDGTNGPVFSTFNGSWASLNGSTGYDTTNKVLIAQMTTNGDFSFELNIQIGTPGGGTEQYVAQNPVGSEILFPGLTYNSATATKAIANSNLRLTAYPNPTTDILNLKIESKQKSAAATCFIYDLSGKLVSSKKLNLNSGIQFEQLDLSALSKGLYFVQLSVDGNQITRKISKQ